MRIPGMRSACGGLAALVAVAAGSGCNVSQLRNYGYFGPVRFKAGRVSEFPVGSTTTLENFGAFVFRDTRGFQVMSAVCTYGEAVLYWNEVGQQAKCVRHGCIYSRRGAVLQGPAARPLPFFYGVIDNGELWVDRSRQTGPTFFIKPRAPAERSRTGSGASARPRAGRHPAVLGPS